MMRADAGLHADQARRHISEPCFHLSARPFLSQHDRTAPIMAHDVERVLADIDADHGDCAVEFLRHGVLLDFGAPGPASFAGGGRSTAGPSHTTGPFPRPATMCWGRVNTGYRGLTDSRIDWRSRLRSRHDRMRHRTRRTEHEISAVALEAPHAQRPWCVVH